MSTTRRTLIALALLTGALAAQQPAPKPGISANPEINELKGQVRDLKKQLAAMNSRLTSLERDQKFRVGPLTERTSPQ